MNILKQFESLTKEEILDNITFLQEKCDELNGEIEQLSNFISKAVDLLSKEDLGTIESITMYSLDMDGNKKEITADDLEERIVRLSFKRDRISNIILKLAALKDVIE